MITDIAKRVCGYFQIKSQHLAWKLTDVVYK